MALKDLGWEIVSDLPAERTPCHNPGIRHGADRRRDILTALFTADGEVALPAFRKVEHEGQYRRRKGEYFNNLDLEIYTRSAAKKLID